MTIETYVDAIGDTYYLVHPAGMSYYDQTPETVTKVNSSVAYLAGSLAICTVNTITGELWQPSSNPLNEFYYRQGIVTADSAAGVATMSIKRVPRRVVSSAMASRRGVTGGDQNNSGRPVIFNNQSLADKLPLMKMSTVVKPTAETWTVKTAIYGYILAGSTLYTNALATASAQSVFWVHGWACLRADPGTVVAYIHQSVFYDGVLLSFVLSPVYGLSKTSISKTITATSSGAAPTLLNNIYTSLDGMSVSSVASATCNILLGDCVGVDGSLATPSYSYIDSRGAYEGGSSDALNAAVGGRDLCLVQAYTDSAIRGGGGGATTGFNIIARAWSSAGVQIVLAAPKFISANHQIISSDPIGDPTMQDMAYEPILPSPFTNLRIIWSYSPDTQVNFPGALFPSISKRTVNSSAPYAGMVKSLRDKPDRHSTGSRFFQSSGFGSSCRYPLLAESRSTPYVWKDFEDNLANTIPYFPLNTGGAVRGAMFPGGVLYFKATSLSLSDFQWRWETYDFTTSTWTALTAYVSGSGAGTTWSATVTPPASGVTGEAVYLVRLATLPVWAGGSGPYKLSFSQDYLYLGAWPFDVVKAYPDSDAGGAWSGNAGWLWPNQPTGPTVSWSSDPSFSLAGNTLTMTTTTPARTVTPDSKFNNALVSGYALGIGTLVSISIVYDDGESAAIPDTFTTGVAYSKGGITPCATQLLRLGSTWAFGNPCSMNVYPSKSGSKNITVKIYYTAIVPSAYSNTSNFDIGYASPRVITQSFTLP